MFFYDISVNRHLKIKETKNHIYIAPHPLLCKYIAHYTISFPNTNEMRTCNDNISDIALIPDSSGCIIYTYENNDFSSSLWGATTKTVTVKNDVNLKKIRFFIEFMPGGLHAITGINQSELCDIQTQVDEVDKNLSFSLIHAMEISNNIDNMLSMVNMIFLKAIEKNNKEHTVIDSALNIIKATNGRLTIKQLSANEYISERQLNRIFNEYIGINAKKFSRLVRINHSINMFKNINYENCLNMTQLLGYFDQSHFIRDFKQICGITPNSFLENMSDFYNEPFKY
ncbi:helix-turn-helix transcriptional regulator [Clostridium estertheticum]|uniref:helix-turn-helix transcriptional regulator n=1 Tax=Clostridium estertheticum TaxID=238834 RepID=UPI001CF40355|nr:helix-turn-helix transcriptional regulator [Clostridium estertheticum]MCB2361904.1 helix-turn-helix transcriptional regulator [Clostridium estertheticum]